MTLGLMASGQTPGLTKEQIVQMSKAGLPDDVIIGRIRAEAKPPQLTTDELVSLKQSGVGDNVIRALLGAPASGPATAPPAAAVAVAADPDDPMSPHDPGVYLMTETREGRKRMIMIERAGANRAKTTGVAKTAFTYGIVKAHVKAELPGPRASVRAQSGKPEFYMYFPPTGNLGEANTISSPSQFSLLKLEIHGNRRETSVATSGFASVSVGADKKDSIKYQAEKIRPYTYKVTPDSALDTGEYAFVASSGMGGTGASVSSVLFDFGIDVK